MAWDTTMITMLRVLIQDFDKEDYTDDRLKQILVVGGNYVKQDIQLDVDYTINVVTPNITPDPTTSNPVDDIFISATVLKSACLIDTGSLRSQALINGIKANCGPAGLTTNGRMDGFKVLMEMGYCKAYQELKDQLDMDVISGAEFARGIMSPFVNEDFIPHHQGAGSFDLPRYK